MKIGIVTLSHGNDNYGGSLQAVALQEYLTRCGHSVMLCNTTHINPSRKWEFIKDCFARHPIRKVQERRKTHAFLNFWDETFHYDPQGHRSFADFCASPTPCDCYICGSDQVWAVVSSEHRARMNYFFLSFVPEGKKRIAYAASLGADRFPEHMHAELEPLLAKFDAVAVREASGVDACREVGRADAVAVCDPTLLMPMDFWNQLADKGTFAWDENLLFCQQYRWKTEVDPASARRTLEQRLNLHARIPFSINPLQCRGRHCSPTPYDWLNGIRSARGVLTNSFHCVIFSILFHKPFLVLALKGKYAAMNARFQALLERLGLSERLLSHASEDVVAKMSAPIDWEAVEAKLAQWRAESASFLTEALR